MKKLLSTLLMGSVALSMMATHPTIQEADALKMEDYTIPTFVQMMVKREKARNDESAANIQALRAAIDSLQSKYEPYCEVVNINGDPKTRMAFNWFTNDSVFDGEVQLVKKENATEADFADPIVIPATYERTVGKNKKGLAYCAGPSGIAKATGIPIKQRYFYTAHKALATGLEPDEDYSYRVGYAGHWSEIGTFHTADDDDDEVAFIVMSDSHIQDQEYVNYARYCATAAARNAGDVDFCLFPGDFVETGDDLNAEWEWERWFEEAMPSIIHKMPIVPTDGNHDDSRSFNYTYHFNADNTFNEWAVNKPQFQGITYSFMYGTTLFLVYSLQDWGQGGSSFNPYYSEYLHTDVANWFREQVEAHPEAKLRISVSHKNIFSGSGHQEDGETPIFRAMMLPVFADCEIDLAIQGHDHCYEVMGPVEPWTRTPIDTAIVDVQSVTRDVNKNETGKYGGTFNVNDGTLYFIGATCGRKRYYPLTEAQMNAQYNMHKVQNYHDLFTSMFGQPEAPSYTRFEIEDQTIKVKSYTADDKGNSTLFHEFTVQRTRPHRMPTGYEMVEQDFDREGTKKVICQGQFLIVRNGVVYNAQGHPLTAHRSPLTVNR